MKIIYLLKVLLFIIICWVKVNAANASIIGTIVDSKNKSPLPFANVFLEGTNIGSASDIDGKYEIRNIPTGRYIVVANYLGYEKKSIEVNLIGGRILELNFALDYSAIEIDSAIIVNAQAQGQLGAINKQLASNTIVNVVSSDKIQEIPDANAAESIGRLPGVSIKREGGEGNQVVIRGLSPKFSVIQMNGVRMASTEGGERSVNLSMISPYMLEGISVMKALTADQDADAMGGTVDFSIKRAQNGFNSDVMVQMGHNQLRNSFNDYKLVAGASNRFFDNKLGIFGQVDIEKRNRSAQVIGVSYDMPERIEGIKNKINITGLNQNDISRIKNRYGGTFVADYNIHDGNIKLTNIFNQAKTVGTDLYDNYGIRARDRNFGGSDGENILTSFTNVLEYQQKFGPFTVNTNLSYTFSENNSPEFIMWNFLQSNAFSENLDLQAHPNEIQKYVKEDLLKTFLYDVTSAVYYNKENALAFKADLDYEFTLTKSITGIFSIGGKYRKIIRNYNNDSYAAPQDGFKYPHAAQFKNDVWRLLTGEPRPGDTYFPYEYFVKGNKIDDFLEGEYTFGATSNGSLIPIVDVDLMWDVAKISTLGGIGDQHVTNSIINDYSGSEQYSAGYLMADINLGRMIKFIPGVRYENVLTDYNGIYGDQVPFSFAAFPHEKTNLKKKNDYWLPQIHLRIKPVEWFDVRLAYTNSLNRPNYNWLVPTQSVADRIGGFTTTNNPHIKPALSKNYDVYLSFHENYLGLFTIGGFYKEINDFIYYSDAILIEDYEYFNLPSKANKTWTSFPINNSEVVEDWGIEISWQTNFWYLPGFLSGLVLDINYTHIFSETSYPRTVTVIKDTVDQWGFPIQKKNYLYTTYRDRLIDQPNDIVNIVIGYDIMGFSARFSVLFQSDVFRSANFWPELRQNTEDYWRWDLSIKQDLPIEGMQFFVNFNNIFAAHDIDLIQGSGFPTRNEFYGYTIDAGLRHRF